MAGGVAGKKSLKAILFGGAAGAFATSEHLNVKMTFEDLRAAGLPLGSGVVMIFDETRDIRDALKRLGKFFAHESCGKCYPCQMGTQRQMEILDRVASGGILSGDFFRLEDVGWTMTESSLCGLGQTAASAVLSAMKLWPELFGESQKSNVVGRKISKASKDSKVPKTVKKSIDKKATSKIVEKKKLKPKSKTIKKVTKTTAKKK
jgi:NADH-quinone oxidoreductase subunit F